MRQISPSHHQEDKSWRKKCQIKFNLVVSLSPDLIPKLLDWLSTVLSVR